VAWSLLSLISHFLIAPDFDYHAVKFCPDEEELVLEIFKQLGSGNSIKDVPVRFRTKDGRIVDLLIDSNVRYDQTTHDFAHTRCFIRDDTQRKIREARTRALLEETERSLRMLDNFMSRSIHHMRTPLHMMQNVCELVAENLVGGGAAENGTPPDPVGQSVAMLREAERWIADAVGLADDLVQLGRFDQGAELELQRSDIDLVPFGEEVLSAAVRRAGPSDKISVSLDVAGGSGPSKVSSDPVILCRSLRALLVHAINVAEDGAVKFQIGYRNGLCTFSVAFKDSASPPPSNSCEETSDKLPPIFQRYQQKFVPSQDADLVTATCLRSGIEKHANSFKDNSIGIGLSLSYFFVRALGSELRYTSQAGISKFWFSLPKEQLEGVEKCGLLCQKSITRRVGDTEATAVSSEDTFRAKPKRSRTDRLPELSSKPLFALESVRAIRTKVEETLKVDVPKACIASRGLSSMDPPHVLVVEDTAMCAKLLCMTLRKLNCSATCVENGRLAVDTMRKAAPGEYNLVLMDIRMPVMDGLEATKALKQELNLAIPVVALTAETSEAMKAECDAIGFDGFCSKPLKRGQLKEVLFKHTGYHVL